MINLKKGSQQPKTRKKIVRTTMKPPSSDHHEIERLETGLDSFDPAVRRESLLALMAMADAGSMDLPEAQDIANLHCHSFFSYNGYGYSPSHLAWLGRKHGIKFMGIVDFDILDGVDEFLAACEITCVHGTAGIETRVYIPEFRHAEINSPGEPGIAYHMGVGFVRSSVVDSARGAFVEIRNQAVQRNLQIMARVNQFLAPLTLDFETDMLPLTPSGYATERHMVQKIAEKSFDVIDEPIRFWAEKFSESPELIERIVEDPNHFQNYLRQKLMKRGGVAYVQPEGESFPSVEVFHEIILAENAIPCSAWLDGTSAGEAEIERLLGLLMDKGVAAINIIPDRNWNIPDEKAKAVKLEKLYHIVDLADSLDLPIIVGTEMNSFGQKRVDDFDAPELNPVKDLFIKGAYFLYGHTRMEMLWGMGYQSHWSQANLADRKAKNDFYEAVGRLIPPAVDFELLEIKTETTPHQVLQEFHKKIKG
jgi:hypothetical protein